MRLVVPVYLKMPYRIKRSLASLIIPRLSETQKHYSAICELKNIRYCCQCWNLIFCKHRIAIESGIVL